MARAFRSVFSLLGVSVVAGVLVAACGGGDDQGQTNPDATGGLAGLGTGGKTGGATGGTKAATGGASSTSTAATGGKATGGASSTSTAATGGKATGGASSTSTAATGGATPVTTGGTSTAGGASATGGVTTAGGASATGGKTGGGGASATGGVTTAGGASATGGKTGGGASATGGVTATGGSAAATGGKTNTGGTPATGGVPATGGTPATGGVPATGGSAATGGGSSLAACGLDDATNDSTFYQQTNFCVPANASFSALNGSMGLSTVNINAVNGVVSITGTVPLTGPLTLAPPFQSGTCQGGLNGTTYAGLSLTVTNNSATIDSTVIVYLADRITVGGVNYYALASYQMTVLRGATVTQSVTWANLTLSCTPPSGAGFNQAQVLGIGFGFTQTGPVNLTITPSYI